MGSIVEVVDFILHVGQRLIHPLHKIIFGIMISSISSFESTWGQHQGNKVCFEIQLWTWLTICGPIAVRKFNSKYWQFQLFGHLENLLRISLSNQVPFPLIFSIHFLLLPSCNVPIWVSTSEGQVSIWAFGWIHKFLVMDLSCGYLTLFLFFSCVLVTITLFSCNQPFHSINTEWQCFTQVYQIEYAHTSIHVV